MTADDRQITVGTGAPALYTGGNFDGQDATGASPAVCRIHSMGWWTSLLLPNDMLALYNGGDGVNGPDGDAINWRVNHPEWAIPYMSAGSLVHYWQFGALFSTRPLVGRDTGINALTSGGNDGDNDLTDDDKPARPFTVAQNVIEGDFPGA